MIVTYAAKVQLIIVCYYASAVVLNASTTEALSIKCLIDVFNCSNELCCYFTTCSCADLILLPIKTAHMLLSSCMWSYMFYSMPLLSTQIVMAPSAAFDFINMHISSNIWSCILE